MTNEHVLKITGSALTEGRLNIRPCGRDFFPPGAFGKPRKSDDSATPVVVHAVGLGESMQTDIPMDQHGRPRWFFRERGWVKRIVKRYKLSTGDNVILSRRPSGEYEIRPQNGNGGKTPLLPGMVGVVEENTGRGRNGELNKVLPEDRPVHEWYRFVLSYPPHLVRAYVQRFGLQSGHVVLDPFCGTGTTVVEARKLGLIGVGVEANPMACFASQTKADWSPDPRSMLAHARRVAKEALERLRSQGIEDSSVLKGPIPKTALESLDPESSALLLKDCISPLPLHKLLVLLSCLERMRAPAFCAHERLAIAKTAVFYASNLHFGPEVGVGIKKADVPVVGPWLCCVENMCADLLALKGKRYPRATVHLADSRQINACVQPGSVDAVITSPPYPNEKDYTRTTRLESVLLGLIQNKKELRSLKQSLVRSNTRNVYRGDNDDLWVKSFPEIQQIADRIEARRVELGKTSGFERLYPRVTKLYFGGMARHLADLRRVLRPGAQLAYVVGDQASYLRVMIRTGEILGSIAESLGYEVVGIDLFRTRLSTATREQLREEVVVLKWPVTKTRKARNARKEPISPTD